MSTPASTSRRATRTRTGCQTCRTRKLKCDEVKPICGHCRKSNRECQPSEGVAFRHAQNAGLAGEDGGNALGNFYKYRQKFDSVTYFLPVPQELSFVHVTDPFADETPAPVQQPQQHNYQRPIPVQYQQPQYVDVAATSLKAMIDPNLEAGTHSGVGVGTVNPNGQETNAGGDMTEAESLNETILNALKHSTNVDMENE